MKPLIDDVTHSLDVLSFQFLEKGFDTAGVGLNSNGRENGLDVGGRWGGIAGEVEEEVGSEVLHFEILLKR